MRKRSSLPHANCGRINCSISSTPASQKKREILFWECILVLLNLKREINIEVQHVGLLLPHWRFWIFESFSSKCERFKISNTIKTAAELNSFTLAWKWLYTTFNRAISLYAWQGVWKIFCQKTIWRLGILIVSAKSMEVPIELSQDCYCDLSVPLPNWYTILNNKL